MTRHRFWPVGIVLLAAAVTTPGPAQSIETYAIPAQPLDAALKAFAAAAGVDMLYESAVVSGKISAPVAGGTSRDAALSALLRGTGLAYRFTGAATVLVFAVERPPAAATAAVPRMMLRTLHFRTAYRLGNARAGTDLAYGRQVQAAVDRALQPDPTMSTTAFSTQVALHVAADGIVQDVRLRPSTGRKGLDERIVARLSDLRLPAPPPGLPQPVRLAIAAR